MTMKEQPIRHTIGERLKNRMEFRSWAKGQGPILLISRIRSWLLPDVSLFRLALSCLKLCFPPASKPYSNRIEKQIGKSLRFTRKWERRQEDETLKTGMLPMPKKYSPLDVYAYNLNLRGRVPGQSLQWYGHSGESKSILETDLLNPFWSA